MCKFCTHDSTKGMKDEIVLYQPNETIQMEVRLHDETVWLNRNQLAILFDRDIKTIGKHINNALKEELSPTVANFATVQKEENPTVAKFATVQIEGNFLEKNGLLFRDGEKVIADHTLVAMVVMIAESKPEEKETMVKLVMNFLDA